MLSSSLSLSSWTPDIPTPAALPRGLDADTLKIKVSERGKKSVASTKASDGVRVDNFDVFSSLNVGTMEHLAPVTKILVSTIP